MIYDFLILGNGRGGRGNGVGSWKIGMKMERGGGILVTR